MATYQVIGKAHVRATYRLQEAVDAQGNRYVVTHAGDPERLEVGALVHDLQPSELAAFPDRFLLVGASSPALKAAEEAAAKAHTEAAARDAALAATRAEAAAAAQAEAETERRLAAQMPPPDESSRGARAPRAPESADKK